MKIELISNDTHNELLSIYLTCPKLSLQNKGYENIIWNELTESEKQNHKLVNDILKKHIKGFDKFQNFRLDSNGKDIEIRFQYDYNADVTDEYRDVIPFTGVGYITLRELNKGFDPIITS